MFPLHRSDDLFPEICSDLHQHQISQLSIDFTNNSHPNSSSSSSIPSPDHKNMISFAGKPRKAKKFGAAELHLGDKSEKMKQHRDIERQRRQEMAYLFASLRSHLPLEFIKGKRSMSDHVHQTVNYIRHLQKQLLKLEVERNELKRMSDSSTPLADRTADDSCFVVRPCPVGIEVMYSCGLREQYLSRVLQLLLEEGLTVLNCVSTKVDDSNFVHSIQSEVEDVAAIDVSQLQQKLTQLVKH